MFEVRISINCYDHVLIHRVKFKHFYEAKMVQNSIMALLRKMVDDEIIESAGTSINNMTEEPG